MIDIERKVKEANKDFYNTIADSYELIDGRRSESLMRYVHENLRNISNLTDSDSILDLGCGSAFISKAAESIFKNRYALDISFEIVRKITDAKLNTIIGDSDCIPTEGNFFSCVTTFAVLHHCYSFKKIIREIYRVLKAGGVFYSDHDMEGLFFRRFSVLLKMYRYFTGGGNSYWKQFKQIDAETYKLSEFHSEGISSGMIEDVLRQAGFSEVTIDYHWYGLSGITNSMFGKRSFGKGSAPLLRIMAVK